MQAFAYFPALVYRDERPDLLEEILPSYTQYLDRVRQPNVPVVQSEHLGDVPEFKNIANYLLGSSVNILRDQGYSVDNYEFYLSGLWVQEVGKWAGTHVHVHKNSQMCGWVFLDTPENGAYPIYHDVRKNKEMVELDYVQGQEVTNATSMIHFNNVVPGSVLFSNSWMQHQLTGGMSDQPTRCIHFIVSHKEHKCNIC